MMAAGLLVGAGFWMVLLPLVKLQDPSLDPRMSIDEFWKQKQRQLNLGLFVYHDAWFVGLLGDKAWAEKMVQWVIKGKEPLLKHGSSPVYALPYLTNQEFPRLSDDAALWGQWWKAHRAQTQEQWIQEGFKRHGFDISLPPTPNDWPALLSILGATAGPEDWKWSPTEPFYPSYLRYNAYRWLRDSGFDPVSYLQDRPSQTLSGNESGGLIQYQEEKAQFEYLIAPMPGRMAFAEPDWHGTLTLDGGIHLWFLLHPVIQTMLTAGCAALFVAGWGMSRQRKTKLPSGGIPEKAMKAKTPWFWRKKRCVLGGLLLTFSLLSGLIFWTVLVPYHQSRRPERAPHLSASGFWQAKQVPLNLGLRWHEDGSVVGLFGGKSWTQTIMVYLTLGLDLDSCASGHLTSALPFLTNHDFSEAEDPTQAWLQWWSVKSRKTQEQWIQDGFFKHGIFIRLPPSDLDWKSLLTILGTTAGPAPEGPDGKEMTQSHRYSFELRYNAYRWLRDSGFDPVRHAVSYWPTLTGEELSGTLGYGEMEQELAAFSSPLPGRLSFASQDRSLFFDVMFTPSFSRLLQWDIKVGFTGLVVVIALFGWWLASPRRKNSAAHE